MATKKASGATKAKKATRKSAARAKAIAKKRAAAAPAKKAARRASPKKAARRAAPAKNAAKKAAKSRTGAARSAAKKPARARAASPRKVQRRDHPGHLDPRYAAELLGKSGGREAEPRSFVERPRSQDDLVEELGEAVVTEATSAEHEGEDVLDQQVPEERGGPFVETQANQEFAHGTDPSNPKNAKREPFPTT